jgi:threonine synthase
MFYSTNNKAYKHSFKEAVLQSLAPDNGLYMPEQIAALAPEFIRNLSEYSFEEISFEVGRNLIGSDVPPADLRTMTEKAINFPAPVSMLSDRIGVLELWHGPSLAFKDFGARYMAQLMSWFIRGENIKLTILVATSGDTGGAVASGFYNTEGIEVIILYPSGKVSELQEKQLTTLGGNITALEVSGTFDDCQALVKAAFLDETLTKQYNLSSANSINISRLIPQTFYYFEAYKQVSQMSKDIVFSVPSGNFGNLTAGLMAKKMGLPVKRFIAATNINKIVPEYLDSGIFQPRPSVATLSNAMDVGNPSNFVRILDLYHHDYSAIRQDITGYYLNDEQTRAALKELYEHYGYVGDPHGAIAFKSLDLLEENELGIFLETAHPSKFPDTVEDCLLISIEIPERLKTLMHRPKQSIKMDTAYTTFREWLMDRK